MRADSVRELLKEEGDQESDIQLRIYFRADYIKCVLQNVCSLDLGMFLDAVWVKPTRTAEPFLSVHSHPVMWNVFIALGKHKLQLFWGSRSHSPRPALIGVLVTVSSNKILPASGMFGAQHTMYILTLARKPCFATFAGVGGVGATPPPWRFQTKRRRASRKRAADCARRVLAIGGIIFGPRSIFDPVMAGQRSNFRKFHYFSTSRVDGIKTIYRSGMKPSPAFSPFNYA